MSNLDFGIQHILDAQGFTVAITGMLIVFAALTIISIFISLLPKLVALLANIFPEGHHHAVQDKATKKDDDKLLAAIGYGLLMVRAKNGDKV